MSLLIFCLILLAIVGLLIYAVRAYLPVDAMFKNLICFILILIAVIALANRVGFF